MLTLSVGAKVTLVESHHKAGKTGTIMYAFPYRHGRRRNGRCMDENLYSVKLDEGPEKYTFLVFESDMVLT